VSRFESLLLSADDLRIEVLAQIPYCADVTSASPVGAFETAQARGFEQLPVRDRDRRIRRLVRTAALEGRGTWGELEGDMEEITADILVARDAPAFSLLDRFAAQPILFTLGRDGIDGIVTVYDLNQPAAYILGFGLALIVESAVSEVLRRRLGEDPNVALERAAAILGPKASGISYWKRARRSDADVHLASKLGFGEKLKVLAAYGYEELITAVESDEETVIADLEGVCVLRNAIGHPEDSKLLEDPFWVYQRMRTANRLARLIAASAM